jgi:hypothetical protein
MSDPDTRSTRGERLGCGCFLIGIGAGVTFIGLLWTAMDGLYGESGILAEAVLFAGLGAAISGAVLFGLGFRNPD